MPTKLETLLAANPALADEINSAVLELREALVAAQQRALATVSGQLTAMTAERDTLAKTLVDHQKLADDCFKQSAPLLTQLKALTSSSPLFAPLDTLVTQVIGVAQTVGAGPAARIAAEKAALKKRLLDQAATL